MKNQSNLLSMLSRNRLFKINKLTVHEKNEREDELRQVLGSNIDMAKYLNQVKFDPCQEIVKEK